MIFHDKVNKFYSIEGIWGTGLCSETVKYGSIHLVMMILIVTSTAQAVVVLKVVHWWRCFEMTQEVRWH